ncbi:MAG: helix-turn-helix domain-containing protein [bacterium]|nr:helix-turn-helix domain-containing protein [bacterium]
MKIPERHKAIALRRQGHSLKEIAATLNVAKSSVSLWVRDVALSSSAKKILLAKITLGQFVAAERKKAKTRAIEDGYLRQAREELSATTLSPVYKKLLCALIYWCEGTKSPKTGVTFINSDPHLIKQFLSLLRTSFEIDERKFHPCLHLHSYHSKEKQLDFWSEITNINRSQFIKPYVKPNTGKRIRIGYPGCLSVKYHSNDLARRLLAVGKAFLNKGV